MNRERAKELLPIIQAYAEGKEVEARKSDRWHPSPCPTWLKGMEYRIKPEKRLRPWKPEEAPKLFMARRIGSADPIWVAYRCTCPMGSCNLFASAARHPEPMENASFKELASGWERVHEDGATTPCGVWVEGDEG